MFLPVTKVHQIGKKSKKKVYAPTSEEGTLCSLNCLDGS